MRTDRYVWLFSIGTVGWLYVEPPGSLNASKQQIPTILFHCRHSVTVYISLHYIMKLFHGFRFNKYVLYFDHYLYLEGYNICKNILMYLPGCVYSCNMHVQNNLYISFTVYSFIKKNYQLNWIEDTVSIVSIMERPI